MDYVALFVSQTDTTLSTVQGWTSIITSTGFGGLVWYLIAKTLPNMQISFDKSLQKITDDGREHCERELSRITTIYEQSIARMMERLK